MNESETKPKLYCGIDFGTTGTSGSWTLGPTSEPRLISANDSSTYWPSTQQFRSPDDIRYGVDPCKDPAHTITDNKRFFGRFHKDVVALTDQYPYKIVERFDDKAVKYVLDFDGKEFEISPQQVATGHLYYLWNEIISKDFKDKYDIHTVITVPAYFTPTQQRATAIAGMYTIH